MGDYGNKCASIVDRLLYSVRGLLAIVGNEGPNLKNIAFGERRESINAHRFDERS
jgi:hypothetical protein